MHPTCLLIPESSTILDGGISCPRSFFYFTLWRGCALLEQQGLAHGHQLGALQGRPRDRPSAPSVALAHLCSKATPLLPHTRTRTTMTAAATKAPLPLTLPERARIHHTRHGCAGRPIGRPQAPGSNMRSRPSTSKPSEDARNADEVDGIRREEARKERRTDMRCSTQGLARSQSIRRSAPDRIVGDRREGGVRRGVGQSANSNTYHVTNVKADIKEEAGMRQMETKKDK